MARSSMRARNVVRVVLITVGACIALLGLSFYYLTGGPQTALERRFEDRLLRAQRSSSGCVYVRDLAQFEWDRVCATHGYTPVGTIDEILGLRFRNKRLRAVEIMGNWGLLFIDSEHHVTLIRVPARVTQLYGSSGCADRDRARLIPVPYGVELGR
jgi:hypothetical protein